jgi:subtilisin family serine protease
VGGTYDADVGGLECDPTTAADQVMCISNVSDDLDLFAPGAMITSTALTYAAGGGACHTQLNVADCYGTSMAAPHAVGVAALLKQALPHATPDEIEAALKGTGVPVTDDYDPGHIRTKPRVDAAGAVLEFDYDGDGCPNGNELENAAGSEETGGLRDPENEWDYFNPSGDGRNRVDDIVAVVNQYYDDDDAFTPGTPPYAPGYNPATDRTVLGPNAWNLGPPNGIQRVDDIVTAINHYFHDCS